MSATEALDVITPEVVAARPPTRPAMTPTQVGEWVEQIDQLRRAVLQTGVDFGVIPGTPKPSLFKPGAEKLLLFTGLGFRMEKLEDEDSREHTGVTYRCTVHRGEEIVAQCEGYAGYDESRFYVSAEDAVRRERARSERFQKPTRPEHMVEYRAPWNSVLKMSQKRALVGAVLNATATSGLFTQDLEDQAEAPGAWDPGEAVLPFIQQLDDETREALSEWRQENNVPLLRSLSPLQGVGVGVQIGRLLARQEMVAEFAAREAALAEAEEGLAEREKAAAARGPEGLAEALEQAVPTWEDDMRSSVARMKAVQVAEELQARGLAPDSWPRLEERKAALLELILGAGPKQGASPGALQGDDPF